MSEDPTAAEASEVDAEVARFWIEAKRHARIETAPGYFGPDALAALPPPTWGFGDDELGERLLGLVLDGTKTAMASARDDYDGDDQLPQRGAMSILLDGAGHPQALLVTREVDVVAFDEVTEQHALAEGEGDLPTWRTDHEAFFTEHDPTDRGFRHDMPVVLETFEVLYQV